MCSRWFVLCIRWGWFVCRICCLMFSSCDGCIENLVRFMFSSRCVMVVLLVILLYIEIGLFVWWVLWMVCVINCSIVGCSGLYRCVIVLLVWLMVSVYWIRLFVLIERKFMWCKNIGRISMVVGILIMVLILMFGL